MQDIAVYAKNLTKKFGDFFAVDNISFEVKKGTIYGFLGANGAGKTTTIRMLCGLITPTSGDGFVCGFSIKENSEEVKKRIGYMSQKFSLYNILTVRENLEFYGGIYGLDNTLIKKRVDEISEKINLKEELNRLVEDLPGGIKQRVALACAIIHNPEVIFLDEPTAGVDPVLRKKFWDIIDEFSLQGKTVFVTTHYMDEVEHCHKIALMDEGKIIKEGSISEIKKQTFDKKIYEITIGESITEYKKLIEKKEKIGDISLHGSYIHIITDFFKEKLEQILSENNIKFLEIRQINPSMEDVFIKLVKKQEK